MMYPVAVRLSVGSDDSFIGFPPKFSPSFVATCFTPAEWCMEHTPIRTPILKWGDLCGVRQILEFRLRVREMETSGEA